MSQEDRDRVKEVEETRQRLFGDTDTNAYLRASGKKYINHAPPIHSKGKFITQEVAEQANSVMKRITHAGK